MAIHQQALPTGRPVGVSSEDVSDRGAEDAFADALLDATRLAFRALRSMGLSPDDAADVIQDASIRAWRHRDQRHGSFPAWFVAIAYREARRPRRSWLTLPTFWPGTRDDLPENDPDFSLRVALQRLPRRQRHAVSLRYGSDLSIADVARTLRISEPATKQLLARARESLRRTITAMPAEER